MVIGAFFTEVGTELLKMLSAFNCEIPEITQKLVVAADWSDRQFAKIDSDIRNHTCSIDAMRGDLESMKRFN